MPVSIATNADPFRGRNKDEGLRTPQARVLRALMPKRPDSDELCWPLVTRAMLAVRAGYTALSGTVTRALNGIRPYNKKSGDPHPGLIERGLIEVVRVDVCGLMEVNYRITASGVSAYLRHVADHGELPPLKDAALCVNDRYRKDGDE